MRAGHLHTQQETVLGKTKQGAPSVQGVKKMNSRSPRLHSSLLFFFSTAARGTQAGTRTASGNIPLVLCEVWKTRGLTG